jgi:histidinol phosphatase-like PHP family hydrolase
MTYPIHNLHNHTPFSDGAYTMDELCEAHRACDAVEFTGIGITDGLFCTPSSREIQSERDFERTFARETRGYVEAVHDARRRWAGKLHVFCGCEINWPLNKGNLGIIRNYLNGIDYVLFEYVDWAGLTQLANQVRRWPCPVGLAHTDVTQQFPNTSMDQVVRTMANARIFYEANVSLLPMSNHNRWFNTLPNHRVLVAVGTDTHDDLECLAQVAEVVEYIDQRGLSEKYFQPRLRTEEAEKATTSATRTA